MLFDPEKREHFLNITSHQRIILMTYPELYSDPEVFRHVSIALKNVDGYKILVSYFDLEELESVAIDIIQRVDDHEIAVEMDNLIEAVWNREKCVDPDADETGKR